MEGIKSDFLLMESLPDTRKEQDFKIRDQKVPGDSQKAATLSINKQVAAKIEISTEALLMRRISQMTGQGTQVQKRIEEKVYEKVEAFFSFTVKVSEGGFDIDQAEKDDELDKLDSILGDWSSDKVSDRIVDFAKSVYSWYSNLGAESKDNSATDEAKASSESKIGPTEDFEKAFGMIKNAIDAGFGSAKDELGNPGGIIGRLIGRTYQKVQDKLETWRQSMMPLKEE